ncbi:E3 ubiquitin-protein ligase rnf213-alpha-like [Amphiura filiformis]|uniref:E3 ubiquitin-protein ligase rnf213-alpha-like n=1 Tax=Amphiura filiformis TaxID=82378 RepID=UPI003B20D47B
MIAPEVIGYKYYNRPNTQRTNMAGPSTERYQQSNTWIKLDVLVSPKCFQHRGDKTKLNIHTFLKRERGPKAEKIHVSLTPVNIGEEPQMVPDYIRFQGKVQLPLHWLEWEEPLCIRYRYFIDGKKESHPKDVKKRLLWIPSNQQGVYHHHDYPIYLYDDLENPRPEVDSLIEDCKVSVAARDAQLTFLTFLPHLTGRTPSYQQRLIDEVPFQDVARCLQESGKANMRIPGDFDHKKVLLHHMLTEINLPQSQTSLYDLDPKHQFLLIIRVCMLINDNKLDIPMEEQQMICSRLVLPDIDKEEVDELIKFVEESCPEAGSILQAFIQNMPDTCYGWLQLLPLLHFLRKDCEPFGDALSVDEDLDNPRFWGTHELDRNNSLNASKLHETKNRDSFLIVLNSLCPLFKMDVLLIRGCLWLQCSPEGLLLMLENVDVASHITTHTLCDAMIRATTYQQSPPDSKCLLTILDVLVQRVRSAKSINLTSYQRLIENILRKTKTIDGSQCQVVYKVIDVYIEAFSKLRLIEITRNILCEETKESLQVVTAEIGVWLKEALPGKICSDDELTFSTEDEPMVYAFKNWNRIMHFCFKLKINNNQKKNQIWNNIFVLSNSIEEEEYKELWKTQMSKHLKARFWNNLSSNALSLTAILQLYCHDDNAQKYFALYEVAMCALEELVKSTDPFPDKCRTTMSKLLVEKYQCAKPSTLQNLLSWPPFLVFFKMRASGRTDILSEECFACLEQIWSVFQTCSNTVITGSITIEELKQTVAHSSVAYTRRFLELYQLHLAADNPLEVDGNLEETTQQSVHRHREDMERLTEIRKQEVERLEEEKRLNDNLKRVCNDLRSVDNADVASKLAQLKYPIKLSEVCTPTALGDKLSRPINTEESCFFKHPKEVEDMLHPLIPAFESSLFKRAMQNKASDVQQEKRVAEEGLMSIPEMTTTVWQPVYDSMKTFVDELRDGTIRLVKIEDMLQHLGDEPERLKEEIEKNKKEEHSRTLQDVSKEVQHLSLRLKTVAEYDQLQYLENLSDTQSKELVAWIREEIDDLEELEVFVDLAAGDTDAEFATVLKFHHAATGHAAFIFDFKETCDSNVFLDVLESLSSTYRIDPILQSQWEDTKSNLTRLKQIRNNMDSSPLQQAELINERGVYTIGKYEADQVHKTNLNHY